MRVKAREKPSIWKEIMVMLARYIISDARKIYMIVFGENFRVLYLQKQMWTFYFQPLLHFGQEFRTLCITIAKVNLRLKRHELD